MDKTNLYTWKRYLLILVLAFLLIGFGAVLEKTWRMTPESHFNLASKLLDQNTPAKALPHLIMASKSKQDGIQMLASYRLAQLYHHGAKAIPVNMEKAVKYYEKAATLSFPIAQYQLALLYDVGDKIPENRERAIQLMRDAAQTLPEAKYALAVWIERGYLGEPNMDWIVSLYEQAAHAGIQNAMKGLIAIYHGGHGRFPENVRRERYWRQRLEGIKK